MKQSYTFKFVLSQSKMTLLFVTSSVIGQNLMILGMGIAQVSMLIVMSYFYELEHHPVLCEMCCTSKHSYMMSQSILIHKGRQLCIMQIWIKAAKKIGNHYLMKF